MGELSKLPNIGKTVEAQLIEAGIDSPEKLKEFGSRAAWLKIQENDPSACYNRLCALEGAGRGVRWHDLPPEVKEELKDFYKEHKR